MDKNIYGNRITDNALNADDGRAIINKALEYIKIKYGWIADKNQVLFSGVYYDSQKVGSYIVKVKNDKKEKAVLKIQLKPLLFDEGFIIRHIESQNKSLIIRIPKIINDEPWKDALGFGYLIFEDLSGLPNIWKSSITDNADRKLHGEFLKEFLNNVLPITSWFETSIIDFKEAYKKSFAHFFEIAKLSNHKHISANQIEKNKLAYFKVIDNFKFSQFHFTHAHMSGDDIKYDAANNQFIVMANLYWSFRVNYYELTFPIWVDIMHIRNRDLKLSDIIKRINSWGLQWRKELYDHDPTVQKQYWFNLLERAVTTVMLDLGSSEWPENEIKEKRRLLKIWQELFDWIIEKKFSKV